MSRDKLASQILGMIPLFHRKLLKKYKSNELKRTEFLLLNNLMMADGLPMNTYGEKLCISKPNLTKLVHELVDKKWVKKEKSEEDKRVTRIYITDQGCLLLKENFKRMKEQVIASTEKLTDDEVETLVVNFESIHKIFLKLDDMYDE
jgi:DNA-binding MarR family transcriptional regulator